MTTTTHTPGPWTLIEGHRYGDLLVLGPTNTAIATVHSIHNGVDRVESPDANLIAAAPGLLKALEVMVERMERTGREENRLDAAITDKARAAIAKAKALS